MLSVLKRNICFRYEKYRERLKTIEDRKYQWFTRVVKCVLKHDFKYFGYEKKDVICSQLKKQL